MLFLVFEYRFRQDILNKGHYLNYGNRYQPTSALKSDAIFRMMAEQAKKSPEVAKKVNAIFQWNIKQDSDIAAVWSKHF